MLRRGVSVDCRFFRDSDEVVKIVWYPCAEGAPVLPFPSRFRPRSQAYYGWIDTPIGEVAGAPAKLNHKKTPPFVRGQHVCGTAADFRLGGVRDDSPPVVQYDRNGIPVCCQPPIVGDGGAVASGTADFDVSPVVHTQYRLDFMVGVIPKTVTMTGFGPTPTSWFGSAGGAAYQMQSPTDPGNPTGLWQLLASAGLNFTTWEVSGTWDGNSVVFPTLTFNTLFFPNPTATTLTPL